MYNFLVVQLVTIMFTYESITKLTMVYDQLIKRTFTDSR